MDVPSILPDVGSEVMYVFVQVHCIRYGSVFFIAQCFCCGVPNEKFKLSFALYTPPARVCEVSLSCGA